MYFGNFWNGDGVGFFMGEGRKFLGYFKLNIGIDVFLDSVVSEIFF